MTNDEKTCQRKKKYDTFAWAHRDVQAIMRKNKGHFLHVYKCPVCGFFHVGHIPEKTYSTFTPRNEMFLKAVQNVTPLKQKKGVAKKRTYKVSDRDSEMFQRCMSNVTPLTPIEEDFIFTD